MLHLFISHTSVELLFWRPESRLRTKTHLTVTNYWSPAAPLQQRTFSVRALRLFFYSWALFFPDQNVFVLYRFDTHCERVCACRELGGVLSRSVKIDVCQSPRWLMDLITVFSLLNRDLQQNTGSRRATALSWDNRVNHKTEHTHQITLDFTHRGLYKSFTVCQNRSFVRALDIKSFMGWMY